MLRGRVVAVRTSAACAREAFGAHRALATLGELIAEARSSASVILVRDAADGLETFMVRRHTRSPVAPDAYVFPGGTVRADDRDAFGQHGSALADRLSARSDVAVAVDEALAVWTCAVRELFEEAGVLLVRHDSGDRDRLRIDPRDTARQERWASTRLALQAREQTLHGILGPENWQPAFDDLMPFSHWVTPSPMAARFDTWFFVAAMPSDQEALHDTIETSESVWIRPVDALSDTFYTVFATAQHLRRLVPFGTVDDLVAFARTKPIRRVQPELVETATGVRVVLPEASASDW